MSYGRDVVGLPCLLGIVSPSNTASSQLLRKLGMHLVDRIEPNTDLYRMEFPLHNT